MTKCPLCGNVFDEESSKSGCAGCGVKNCGLVKCTNCGYEFLPEKTKKKKGFLKSLLKKEE